MHQICFTYLYIDYLISLIIFFFLLLFEFYFIYYIYNGIWEIGELIVWGIWNIELNKLGMNEWGWNGNKGCTLSPSYWRGFNEATGGMSCYIDSTISKGSY
jgi:hypothetical protein